jgi:hypothetical protein
MSVKNIGLKKQIVLIKVYRNKQSKQKSLPLSWFINFLCMCQSKCRCKKRKLIRKNRKSKWQ